MRYDDEPHVDDSEEYRALGEKIRREHTPEVATPAPDTLQTIAFVEIALNAIERATRYRPDSLAGQSAAASFKDASDHLLDALIALRGEDGVKDAGGTTT